MIRFYFFIVTFILGFLGQILLHRYFSFGGASFDLVLLTVVALGFIVGPVMGETMGFVFGLAVDSLGVGMFGLNSLLLACAGYGAGKLRRRVDSEQNTPQMVIGLVSTLLYMGGILLVQSLLEESSYRFYFWGFLLKALLNSVFAVVIFKLVAGWTGLWRIPVEHNG